MCASIPTVGPRMAFGTGDRTWVRELARQLKSLNYLPSPDLVVLKLHNALKSAKKCLTCMGKAAKGGRGGGADEWKHLHRI